jgi:hypothetical protein
MRMLNHKQFTRMNHVLKTSPKQRVGESGYTTRSSRLNPACTRWNLVRIRDELRRNDHVAKMKNRSVDYKVGSIGIVKTG